MQETHNSIALAMELCLSYTNPSKCKSLSPTSNDLNYASFQREGMV